MLVNNIIIILFSNMNGKKMKIDIKNNKRNNL